MHVFDTNNHVAMAQAKLLMQKLDFLIKQIDLKYESKNKYAIIAPLFQGKTNFFRVTTFTKIVKGVKKLAG